MKALLLLWVCVCALALAACGGTTRRASPRRPTALASAPHSKAYEAALAYARCMREHGVAHPNPDANGDFELTPAQERRMRASSTPKEHEAADKACFRHLKGTVSTKPLSKAAQKAARGPLRDLAQCLHGFGYDVGKPMVRNMSRGRAMFGFESTPQPAPKGHALQRLQAAQHTCEQRVHLSQRIDAIVKADRGEGY